MPLRPLPPGPAIVGIINVTPDSFSDGGRWTGSSEVAARARALVEAGAAALDVGAESTRPGAEPVAPEAERERLIPALRAVREAVDVPLSVDTRNASTAIAALEAGADVLNDVSGLRHDPELAAVAASSDATLVLMHSRGKPADMEGHARYDDVVVDVAKELERSMERASRAGCRDDRIVLDPGFGFAKTARQSWELLARLDELLALGRPLLVGVSRKRMIGDVLARGGNPRPVGARAAGSVGAGLAAVARGASWLRVHDVAEHADALAAFVRAGGSGALAR